MTANDRRTPLAAGLDTFAVVLFVSIGRREHERDSAISGLISTAAPFLIALAIAWLALRVWQRPTEVRSGIAIWAVVVLVGMLLRHFLFDDGTAASFVIVATIFLGFFIVGWRAVLAAVEHRRTTSDAD